MQHIESLSITVVPTCFLSPVLEISTILKLNSKLEFLTPKKDVNFFVTESRFVRAQNVIQSIHPYSRLATSALKQPTANRAVRNLQSNSNSKN